MTLSGATTTIEIKHGHLFCGLGGGAKGFNRGRARVGNLQARFRCIGGIDNDPAAIRDFTRAAGVEGTVLDLFTREQYVAFHGKEPPAGWREATIDDVRRAMHNEDPDVVFLSAPCKGFSGLLAEAQSKTDKYQALNGLTLRGVWLMLEAWKDNPVKLIVFENVPRIAIRGRYLLDQIVALLRSYGYDAAETTHDCGELGGLSQSRKRFLLVARHRELIPPHLWQPEKQRLRGVGEVLELLPLPGDPAGGPMHRMPALQWKTWVRLAFVEAGSDWRSLNRLNVADGVLTDFGIMPDVPPHNGVLGVQRWDEPSGVVTSRGLPNNGNFAVADPRFVSGGGKDGYQQYGVRQWNENTGAVINVKSPGQGPHSVADPRHLGRPLFNNVFRIVPWDAAAPAVAGPGSAAGGISVADPRMGWDEQNAHPSKLKVQDWDEPAGTVSGARFGSGAGAVADPRPPQRDDYKATKYRVTSMDEPAGAVIGASTTGNGAFAVADPRPARPPEELHGKFHVTPFDAPTRAVIGGRENGAFVVADPRTGLDPDRENYKTGGHYGVVPWDETSRAVPGFAKHDRGPFSVADPRNAGELQNCAISQTEPDACQLPGADERLVCVIRALDNTWHRPFTTLELAALQSLVDPEEVGSWALDGKSDSAWRERIGNAVPPRAAQAIADELAETILLAASGVTFVLSNKEIWVRKLALALTIDHSPNDLIFNGDCNV